MTVDPVLLRTETPQPEGAPPTRGSRRVLVVGLLVAMFGIVLVTALLPAWLTTPAPGTGQPPVAVVGTSDARRIQATLFYLSESGTRLVETGRSVLHGETSSIQVRRIVEAQVATAPEGLASPIPAGTTVRAAFVTEAHEAYVDLAGKFASGLAGGSLAEALAVYAIVNAITVNLPDITGVQILIDGREVDTLAGHIDLRAPLAKSLAWVEGAERTTETR